MNDEINQNKKGRQRRLEDVEDLTWTQMHVEQYLHKIVADGTVHFTYYNFYKVF